MDCEEFLYVIQHYLPQELEQVERIWVIEHIQECESCCRFVSELVFKAKDDIERLADLEIKRLAELDKKVIL
jgi:predicted anti-sigma-YlaC factor YlaD